MDVNGGREEMATIESTVNATTPNMQMADNGDGGEAAVTAAAAVADNNMATIDSNIPITMMANDVIANLDVGDDEHPGDCYDNTDGDHEKVEKGESIGVQQAVNKVITERLAEEVRENNTSADTWLLNHLRENEWWIRKEHAHRFAARLGVAKQPLAFYRDIFVWLPDIKYGRAFMPCCPNCKSNTRFGNIGFRKNHFGRLIFGMNSTSYCWKVVLKGGNVTGLI